MAQGIYSDHIVGVLIQCLFEEATLCIQAHSPTQLNTLASTVVKPP